MTLAAGETGLEPTALHAEEAISAPFSFTVDMVAGEAALQADRFLGLTACVKLSPADGPDRFFHGVMRSFRALGPFNRSRWRYRCELVPGFWFASQTVDCRIFQNMTGLDIVQAILTDNQVTATSITATANAVRAYTAQYNETDYDFAVRLMEEEGYFWFFTHAAGSHTMVIANANTAFAMAADATFRVVPTGSGIDVLTSFGRVVATVYGKVTLADYDPLQPSDVVQGEQATVLQTPGFADRDVFRFPSLTTVADVATARARIRQEAAEAAASLYEGLGVHSGLAPGLKFTIAHDRLTSDTDTDYVVHRIVHEVSGDANEAGAGLDSYANSFDAFPVATPWRDWPQERRPVMAGIHTAIVVGNDGEEIHTDQYGRIKVRFFWDHRRDATAGTTIFIRVMQPWSGNGWGWQHLPRVGSEVAVAFVNGDPDSPIVVGSLYNANQMPPFALPSDQTKTGLRTRSTKNGGTSDYSEWSVDDKMGSELVFFHAQKDFTEEVENDQSTHVMHDQTLKVDNARILKVGKTEDIDIGDAQTIKIGNGRTTKITKADDTLTVDMGDLKIKASMGNVAVEAMQSIELKVGSNSIKIDQMGITMKGMMTSIQGTIQLDLKGLMTNLKGDAMLMIKGAITMIN